MRRGSSQGFGIKQLSILLSGKRNIETPQLIYSIHPIKRGFTQIDKTNRPTDTVLRILISDPVVGHIVDSQAVEPVDDILYVVTNLGVGVYEFEIDVG